jgi:BON domain
MKRFGRGYVTLILITVAATLALMAEACSASHHSPDDQQIVSSIDAKLYQDPDLKTLSVNVTSKQGVVTLSGTVNAPVEKLAVEDLARKTAGVKQVVDNLTMASLSEETGAPAPPPEQAAASPRRPHRRRHGTSAAANQSPPANEEAQNAPQPAPDKPPQAQENDLPGQDNPPQAQDTSRPAGSDASSPSSAVAPASAPAAAGSPTPQAAPVPPPSAPPPQQVTIPARTVISVQMIDSINSGTAQPGQIYEASLSAPVSIDNQVVVPRGATARVRVVDVQSAGHFQGRPLLKLELAGLTIDGTKYSAKSDYYTKLGQSRGKKTAEKVGGGAALGALLGGLIGHGRGAGIGAIIGAGAGTVDQKATQAQEVRIPSEARIDFTLKSPVSVTIGGGQ